MSRRRNTIGMQRRRAVAEAVAAPERMAVAEAGVAEAAKQPGRILIRLIEAGWSKNGTYYPAAVLKRDGAAAWPAGTHSFIDHASPAEDEERPVGSVAKLAAVQVEDARWDEASRSLVAYYLPFEPWKTPILEMARAEAATGVKAIGVSIRAWVTGEQGTAEGRDGFIVESIPQGRSVDIVTQPAAGGAILAVLESIQQHKTSVAEAASVGTYLESRMHMQFTEMADYMYGDGRLTREERITLSGAVGDALAAFVTRIEADAPHLYKRGRWDDAPDEGQVAEALADDTRARLQRAVQVTHGANDDGNGAWLWDFDPDEQFVIYSADGKTWRQSYTAAESGLVLTGDSAEVARRTSYVPVDAPAAEAVDTAPAPAAPARSLISESVAAVLARADQALQNSPGHPVTATADGSPPTAPNPTLTKESTMSGTAPGTQPDQAGNQNGTPVAEEVAVVAAERDQLQTRLTSMTEALSDAQSAQRTAEARAKAAEARAQKLEGQEAGRLAVDKALRDNTAGISEALLATIGPRVHDRVRGGVPFTDDGKVDAPALEAVVVSAIKTEAGHAAQILEHAGVGRPSGLGGFGGPEGTTAEAFEADVSDRFQRIGALDAAGAAIAAKGR